MYKTDPLCEWDALIAVQIEKGTVIYFGGKDKWKISTLEVEDFYSMLEKYNESESMEDRMEIGLS